MRVRVVGPTVTTCTCDIWSCGIVNSCGVADAEAFAENEVMPFARSRSLELQPVNNSTRETAMVF